MQHQLTYLFDSHDQCDQKNRKMSIKVAKNVGDLGKLIVAKGFKKYPKVQ